MRDLQGIGRCYAAMEAEIARLNQQSAELQGRLLLFVQLSSSVVLLSYCVLSPDSLARAQRERDDVALQSSELKGKLDSAREEADKRERAATQRLGAVANSLSGSPNVPSLYSLSCCCSLFFCEFIPLCFRLGYLGAPAGSSSQALPKDLQGALVALEGAGGQTGNLLSKAVDAMTCIHGSVFPKAQPPSSFGELAELFGPDASTITDFRREHTVRGSQTVRNNLSLNKLGC